MELWLDTLDKKTIDQARDSGLLHGITTNPSILSKSKEPLEIVLEDLLGRQGGPVAVQVTASTAPDIVKQARQLVAFSPRIIVKIPAHHEGFKAIAHCSRIKIPVMATAIFTALQGLLAAKAGSRYLAPYYSHMENRNEEIKILQTTLHTYSLPSRVIAASVKSKEQLKECLEVGVAAITIKEPLYQEWVDTSLQVLKSLEKFEEDWKTAPPSTLLNL